MKNIQSLQYITNMKQTTKLWMLATLLVLLPLKAWAGKDFVEDPSNYTITYNAPGTMVFEMPVYEQSGSDSWVTEGKICYTPDGGSQVVAFKFWCTSKDMSNSSKTATFKIESYVGGTFTYKKSDGNDYAITSTMQEFQAPVSPGTDNYPIKVEWFVPYELRGKRVKFEFKVHMNGNTGEPNKDITDIDPKTVTLQEAPAETKPTVSDPILAYDKAHTGQIMVPWSIAANSNLSSTAYWTLPSGTTQSLNIGSESAGFLYVDAFQPNKSLYVKSTYKNMEGVMVNGQESEPRVDIPMLHTARNLAAKMMQDGQVRLTWKVDYPDYPDIMQTDQFEVQRTTDGNPDPDGSGWRDVGVVDFVQGQTSYEFTDETLLDAYKGEIVHYRVRRLTASGWDWSYDAGISQTALARGLSLPAIGTATVSKSPQWGQDGTYEAIVKFNFAADPDDSTLQLFSAGDWELLAQRVAAGETVHAIMADDIDLSATTTMLGTTSRPFKGTFDGNGHTLTINYSTTQQYTAPFSVVSGESVIKNLHVEGNATSTAKFTSGIVGYFLSSGSSLTLENCRSSVAITGNLSGDATNGGLVALAEGNRLTIKGCLFDGKLLGANCYNNGGIVGWVESTCKATITGCLFDPAEIGTKTEGCNTFTRARSSSTVTITNSYATQYYYGTHNGAFIIRNANDWETFRQKVKEAGGNSDVNAILDGDFTVTTMVEDTYRGTFDGNSHTITLNINATGTAYAALFKSVGAATFKNLTIDGSITGGIHTAALIGLSVSGNEITINQCRVSATVNFGGEHGGGFVGHGDRANHHFNNCLFDGTGYSLSLIFFESYFGAFIGWENGDTSNRVKYCVEAGTYVGVTHAGANYMRGTPYGWSDNNKCFSMNHRWGETQYLGDKTSYEVERALVNDDNTAHWYYPYDSTLDYPVPIMDDVKLFDQGFSAKGMSVADLVTALGNTGWTADGAHAVTEMQIAGAVPISTVGTWDSRAKLVLYINKMVNGEVRYTERREVSDEEREARTLTAKLTTSCVDYAFELHVERGTSPLFGAGNYPVTKAEVGDAASYEFNNRGNITALTPEEQQTSVRLEWETDGGDIDYYRILRHDQMEDVDTLLADNYSTLLYIDNDVQPGHNYVYTVEGVTQCEGTHVTSKTAVGHCTATGMVRGYVRLADGTGLPGRKVTAEGAVTLEAVTDSTGYFEIASLVYQGEGSYTLTVETTGEETAFQPISVSFNQEVGGNLRTNVVFTQSTYYRFSGVVLYEGSSIPVMGASFLRDGIPVMNAKGELVVTDTRGKFSVSIPQGSHTIQVVKEGHKFMNNGYYLDADKTAGDAKKINWQTNHDEVYLWDQTKVTLHGRVVGGNDQGQLPLGQSLSKNNLGDDLTITMALEGDNVSWLVRDQLDSSVKERDLIYAFGEKDQDTTRVHMTRQTITIHPDVRTGEYEVQFYPVKYKVTEVYAEGYSTLFQAGTVGETLDLTTCQEGDTATWNRIYHAPATLHRQQINSRNEDYFGVKTYTSIDNAGGRSTITLWDAEKGYAFGDPVFMAGSSVALLFSAREEYYYNNDPTKEPDVVKLHGGTVKLQNGFIGTDESSTIALDEDGQGHCIFTPQNNTFTQTGDKALHTLALTLLYDGTYYDVEPVRGYVMAAKAKEGGRKVVSSGGTILLDILRDPPGATSYSYIEEGSKFNASYSWDITAQAGVKITTKKGSGSNYFTGIWAGVGNGTEAGQTFSTKNTLNISMPIYSTYYGSWQYNYTFENSERIQTSTSKKSVGMDGDVYIGVTQNVIVEDAVAVRAVTETTYQRLAGLMGSTFTVDGYTYKTGSSPVKVLAEGKDATGGKVYLICDEVMQAYTKMNSSFAHSQSYILKELIPSLAQVRSTLLLPQGTDTVYAQAVADRERHPVYISLVSDKDDTYASVDDQNKPTYTQIDPTGTVGQWNDSISAINQQILTWASFIAQNEQEKLEARDLVKSYDFDGRTTIQYSETFSGSATEARYVKYPFTAGVDLSALSWMLPIKKAATEGKPTKDPDEDDNVTSVDFQAAGTSFSLKFQPILSFNYNDKYGGSETHSKKTGFTLSADRNSNYVIDVYRTRVNVSELKDKAKKAGRDVWNVLSQEYIDKVSSSTALDYYDDNMEEYANLVFRTRGGATTSPYENQRVTLFYNPGTELDARTLDIDRPRIWAEQSTVSNVPYGEPARFTIYLANESEAPNRAADNKFWLMLEDFMNPDGAKVQINGNPLPGEGHYVYTPVGKTVTMQVEVYAGDGFDYEDIGLALLNQEDPTRVFVQKLSAHFVPTAGNVNISLPGNKWVMNTESAYDKEKQDWYLPVRIDGFDVNYRGFDHIELQYKLSTASDKDWVNVCSYYASDSLMALASGNCEKIRGDGYIIPHFFGETSPIEQNYDLRAVCYCRYGGGYLTRSSEVLTGVKDTRRPQAFGTPKPTNGILGIGDDIVVAFSEQIAGNYLSEVNNFEVLGKTNSSNISLGTSLRFNGNGCALSTSERNLGGKDFSIDLMLNPDANGKAMTFFSHGYGDNAMQLGLTTDRRLQVNLADTVFCSKPIDFNGMRQVAVVFDTDVDEQQTDVTFYDGSTQIGSYTYNNIYNGTGLLFFGSTLFAVEGATGYEGEMQEVRLWNMALKPSQLDNYAQKHLTGYELGLVDNYPMNEGQGDYCYDNAVGGNDLLLLGTSWKVPEGISMKLDGKKGFRIAPQFFAREDYQDYTMMFWFRTEDKDGTLLANGMATDEADHKEHFRFAVENGLLKLNLSGREILTDTEVADGAWHHTALTVNRSRNVGNLYLDRVLKQTFTVDTLGGISGNQLAAGAVYDFNGKVSAPISGNIDEIAMYEMCLPENLLTTYSNSQPTGEEMGTMAYLSFSRSELQLDNTQRLMPTGISLRRYRDSNTGKLIESRRDTIVAQAVVDALADRTAYAPMRSIGKLENIPYSYVADGKDLYINLDVPDKSIEKTNVYLTIKEVADLNGNLMASAICMDLYVYRSPLRWDQKRMTLNLDYGKETTFEVKVQNLSGKRQPYSIEGLPLWITASQTMGTLSALGDETITLTVSPYINIGDYDEVIYLTGTDEMTEPLPLTIHVRGEEPQWKVSDDMKALGLSMHIVARVEVDGEVAHDTADVLGVFGENHETMGVAHIDVDGAAAANDGLAYVTVYNNKYKDTPLRFEFYDASTGKLHVLKPADKRTITFGRNTIVGTAVEPLVLVSTDEQVQTLHLNQGWNWLSFYVTPEEAPIGTLLNDATAWEPGDGLEVIGSDGRTYLYTYKEVTADDGTTQRVWDNGDAEIALNPMQMYRFYSQSAKTGYMAGEWSLPYVTLHMGWNRIGFISPINLPVATALSDYTDKGSVGDIIKSQNEFAILTSDAYGNRMWKGTLKYLESGQGYMLYRDAADVVDLWYPYYYGTSRYAGMQTAAAPTRSLAPMTGAYRNVSGTSMTVVAVAEGVEVQPGDTLTAWRGAEVCGEAVADEQGVFYLSVGDTDSSSKALTFTLERDGEVVAMTTRSGIGYIVNDALGTPDQPTAIPFVAADFDDAEGWYDLSGRRLKSRPVTKGVYIHGGEKVFVK